MAGIYLHIPFCKQACHYCDFHFSTNLSRKSDMVKALIEELEMRRDELNGEPIQTIYFGGGTPSLLSGAELTEILKTIKNEYEVAFNPEITLEGNPDDLSLAKLQEIKTAGVNRLSIGIQTFDNTRLQYINRAHSSEEAESCLFNARNAGFDNISADLIYAIPPDNMEYWQSDLAKLLSYDLEHISLYGLTIEEKTAFGNWRQKGKLKEVPEETAAKQYELAISELKAAKYEHYEVSNFAKRGYYSRHNTGYWEDQKYLGIGPGAHSYNGVNRSFNISNNARYLEAISNQELALTTESMEPNDRLNDYIFTHLRTNKGINFQELKERHEVDLKQDYNYLFDTWLAEELIELDENVLKLTSKGFMIADEITWRLFYHD
ncbi:radical SAM family heme chaperone HemW [Marinoscillum pacificum]|uniref:radical SAM family heme chaperone HemW n=1 Tax=Marinoscillum pacificum TaxID=392723 RepID=UPI0021579A99|nr:radical SAM family heme chaperone HemW [Marinoscillum pacificum]